MKQIWTQEEVDEHNARQNNKFLHPLTCGWDRIDFAHDTYQKEHGGDWGQLVATPYGWECPVCGYRQGWEYEYPDDGIGRTARAIYDKWCNGASYRTAYTEPVLRLIYSEYAEYFVDRAIKWLSEQKMIVPLAPDGPYQHFWKLAHAPAYHNTMIIVNEVQFDNASAFAEVVPKADGIRYDPKVSYHFSSSGKVTE